MTDQLQGKWALWLLAIAALSSLGYMLVRLQPALILPVGLIVAALLGYELVGSKLFRRRLEHEDEGGGGSSQEPPVVTRARVEVGDRGQGERFDAKVKKLLEYLPDPGRELDGFFRQVLTAPGVRDTHMDNALKFLNKRSEEERRAIRPLLELCVQGLSEVEDNKARGKMLVARVDQVRLFTGKAPRWAWKRAPLRTVVRKLRLDPGSVLELVRARPRILRGLWKNPRPIYAWIVPLLVTLPLVATVVQVWPAAPFWVLYGLTMAGVLGGTCWLSMGLATKRSATINN